MPVLPAVPSVIKPPGTASRPWATASRTISSATRSFTLPPGFKNSALARIWCDYAIGLNVSWQEAIVLAAHAALRHGHMAL